MIVHRHLLYGLTLAALLAATPSSAQQLRKIVVNQSAQSLSAAAVYLARDAGFFEKEGLDVEFVPTGSGVKSILPLLNGQSQFCACIFSHPIDAFEAGAGEVKVIATLITGYNHKIVVSKAVAQRLKLTPDMPLQDRVKALKGLTIGITEPNSSTDQVLRLLMQGVGLNASTDATLIALGAQNLPPAIQKQQIDAFVMTPPIPERSIATGDAVMLIDLTKDTVPVLQNSLYMAIAVDPQYLKNNRETAVKFVRAVTAAQTMLADNPQASRALLKTRDFPAMDQATFDAAFDGNITVYSRDPAIKRANVDTAIELASKFKKTAMKLTADQIIDTSVVADAKAK